MTGEQGRYDIAIIGSGISGSSLGAILARHGLKVIIFEVGGRPQDLRRSLQAVIPQRPHGYDLHIRRRDSDYLLTSVAVARGGMVARG